MQVSTFASRRPSHRSVAARIGVIGAISAGGAFVTTWDGLTSWQASISSDVLILVASVVGGTWCRQGRNASGAPSRVWRDLGLGIWAWGVGQALWIWVAYLRGGGPPPVSIADVGFLAGLALMGRALVSMLRTRSAAWVRLRLATEGAIVTTALVALLWRPVFSPLVVGSSDFTLEWFVTLSYPVADLVLLVIAVMLVPRRLDRWLGLAPLVAGFALLSVADLSFLYGWFHGGPLDGRFLDTGYVAGLLLIGSSAGHVTLDSWGRPVRSAIAGAFPQLVAACLGLVVAAQALFDQRVEPVQIVLLGVVMGLVGLDQLAVLRENRELADDLEAKVDERTEAWRRSVADVAAHNERLAHQATHDALTGLPNRRALFDEFSRPPVAAGSRWWLLLVDLDNFKVVNDGGGHAVGDVVLRHAAERLAGLAGLDRVVRLGGDEFALLVVHPADEGAPTHVATDVLGALREPFAVGGFSWSVGGSVGMAVLPEDGAVESAVEVALRDADLAMYAAKAAGRGRWEVHTSEMSQRSERSQRLMSELRGALERHELVLHFQPIVRVDDAAVVGAEALVRWQHPDRGLLPPADFIDVAEATGDIVPLGLDVLDQALAALRRWVDRGIVDPDAFTMSVNLSTRQLEQPGFVEELAVRMALHGVEPGSLQLEVTETSLLSGDEAVMSRLAGIHELGVRLAVDDFGTGYAGFQYLQRGLFDVVKLDRSLVTVEGGIGDWPVAEAVLGLAGRLRFEVVAEGVEVPEQLAILRELGCPKAQGFLFDRPMPPEEFERSLRPTEVRS